MRTDQVSLLSVLPSTNPAAIYNSNGTLVGATIDTKGYHSLTFVTQSGVLTDGTWTQKIYGSNDSGMSGEVELTGVQLIGAEPAFAITEDGVCKRVGVNIPSVGYRYYRLKLTQAAASTGGFIAALAILGSPMVAPVAATP